MDREARSPLLKVQRTENDFAGDNDSYDTASSGRATPHHHTLNGSGGPLLGYSLPTTYDTFSELDHTNNQTPEDEIVAQDARATAPARGRDTEVGEFRAYNRRWYILFLFCLVGGTQGGVWNTFGPIAATTEDAFGWTDATIALLSNWGPIAYLLSGIIFSWMMDVKGIRMACVVTSGVVAVGTALRCITFDPPAVTVLVHVGQFLNGLGGPVAMATPPILSAVWFPVRQRTSATAIGVVSNYFGVAVPFIMGPLLIPDVPANATKATNFSFNSDNTSYQPEYSVISSNFFSDKNETAAERISKEKKAIAFYMYIAAGVAGVTFLLTVLYFPSRPPVPPSPSAAIPREDFLQGLKNLMTRGQFWLVGSMYGISMGILSSWFSVLDVILKPHGIDEIDAGWIGFYSTCCGCITSLIVARFADFFSRMMKLLILLSYTTSAAAALVFALATINVIPPSTVLIYVTIITVGAVLNATVPLIFELACEISYPTGEGTANGVLTILSNTAGLIFLLVMMIPGLGTAWTNWAMVGTSGICIPLLFFMKESYHRLEIDEHDPSLKHEVTFPVPGSQEVPTSSRQLEFTPFVWFLYSRLRLPRPRLPRPPLSSTRFYFPTEVLLCICKMSTVTTTPVTSTSPFLVTTFLSVPRLFSG